MGLTAIAMAAVMVFGSPMVATHVAVAKFDKSFHRSVYLQTVKVDGPSVLTVLSTLRETTGRDHCESYRVDLWEKRRWPGGWRQYGNTRYVTCEDAAPVMVLWRDLGDHRYRARVVATPRHKADRYRVRGSMAYLAP